MVTDGWKYDKDFAEINIDFGGTDGRLYLQAIYNPNPNGTYYRRGLICLPTDTVPLIIPDSTMNASQLILTTGDVEYDIVEKGVENSLWGACVAISRNGTHIMKKQLESIFSNTQTESDLSQASDSKAWQVSRSDDARRGYIASYRGSYFYADVNETQNVGFARLSFPLIGDGEWKPFPRLGASRIDLKIYYSTRKQETWADLAGGVVAQSRLVIDNIMEFLGKMSSIDAQLKSAIMNRPDWRNSNG